MKSLIHSTLGFKLNRVCKMGLWWHVGLLLEHWASRDATEAILGLGLLGNCDQDFRGQGINKEVWVRVWLSSGPSGIDVSSVTRVKMPCKNWDIFLICITRVTNNALISDLNNIVFHTCHSIDGGLYDNVFAVPYDMLNTYIWVNNLTIQVLLFSYINWTRS